PVRAVLPQEYSHPALKDALSKAVAQGNIEAADFRAACEDAGVAPRRLKQVFKAMQEAGVTVSGIQATAVATAKTRTTTTAKVEEETVEEKPAKKTAKAATTKAAAKKTTAKKAAPTKAAPKKATEEPEAEQDEELEAEDVDLDDDLEEDPADEADDEAEDEDEDGEEAKPKKSGQATEEEEEKGGFVFSDSDEEDQPAQQVVTAGATADPVKDYLKQIGKVALLNAEQEVELAKRIEAGLFAEEKLAEEGDDLAPKLRRELRWIVRDGRRAK